MTPMKVHISAFDDGGTIERSAAGLFDAKKPPFPTFHGYTFMLEVVFGAGPGSPSRPFMDFHNGDFVHFLSLSARFFFGQRLRMSSTTAAM
eukprot:1864258-Prymnesium_polylepis.1